MPACPNPQTDPIIETPACARLSPSMRKLMRALVLGEDVEGLFTIVETFRHASYLRGVLDGRAELGQTIADLAETNLKALGHDTLPERFAAAWKPIVEEVQRQERAREIGERHIRAFSPGGEQYESTQGAGRVEHEEPEPKYLEGEGPMEEHVYTRREGQVQVREGRLRAGRGTRDGVAQFSRRAVPSRGARRHPGGSLDGLPSV